MKQLTFIIAFLFIGLGATAQISVTAQTDRVDASIEVMDNISTVLSYSSQNGLGEYTSVGVKYRKQMDTTVNPVFSVQGQYGLGTFTQPKSQSFLSDQTEFEFAFAYSVFGGINISKFDVGISLNQHLGENRDIWVSPSLSYNF